jgi:hypothetical protein
MHAVARPTARVRRRSRSGVHAPLTPARVGYGVRPFSRFAVAQVTQLTAAKEDLEKRLRLKGEELALAQNADAMLREQLKARAFAFACAMNKKKRKTAAWDLGI